jgi:hypothetical protein
MCLHHEPALAHQPQPTPAPAHQPTPPESFLSASQPSTVTVHATALSFGTEHSEANSFDGLGYGHPKQVLCCQCLTCNKWEDNQLTKELYRSVKPFGVENMEVE